MIATAHKAPDFTAARRHMIESQLRTSGINDAWVLDRMAAIPREDYVPEAARASAYVDRTVPLGAGAFLAPPLAQGQILTHAKPRADERTLLIGPATAYLAALILPLVGELREATPDDVLSGDVDGAFDLVIVDGAVEHVPAQLAATLAPSGRLVTGVVSRGVPRLAIGRHSGADVSLMTLVESQLPRLPAFDRPQSWTF
ncbi:MULTISPECIES: protein-L-isoaspartate O-methyltransferase family protein [Citromicrobium]|uniref:protein-L-isoaspartate O-methyltransferase family protein n=1 Tax=Citromicrobium TaxID=72173 RepID=UPI0001DD0891|nr:MULTISPECIES: protein-L-isoaspartate O-methyltransferase [Citromicrobium]ALG59866.1 protein-L-isoaspartate O-methyltransferase [Citromicrobium sp. JL477]KPM13995.1 protein-L-isoaspartate O-methyltransferase [Citromicrobium sp. JL31]KPM17036.1 protein-L-isoaspartate O-methyltransferase [Citromicrobium sp. JL1351]KPM27367.1 protein-L-isoaspartate O-methyltransferase [Citromicrobium sp. JL2201]